MTTEDLSLETQELLGRLWEESQSPSEKARLLVAIDALRFIYSSGQTYEFADYRKDLEEDGPPLVLASFATRAEADNWLKDLPNPPYHAYILIKGQYYAAMYSREKGRRYLAPHPTLEFYLQGMIKEGLREPVESFSTIEGAEQWLNSQPEPPKQVFITISGEYYLAVYHYRVKLRAIYPVSMAAKSAQQSDTGE